MAVRLSTLAEIKVLSLATVLREDTPRPSQTTAENVREAIAEMRRRSISPGVLQFNVGRDEDFFKTVGIARNVRVDEDYGTQNIYGIGAPTRPRIVPNNFSANATIERIQLDTRDLNHFITRPEYWYSDGVQREIGIDDIFLYTFLFVKSKEPVDRRYDIYALMPRTSQRTVANNDVMIAHNVSMTGFRYSYEEAYFDTTNLINETITRLGS